MRCLYLSRIHTVFLCVLLFVLLCCLSLCPFFHQLLFGALGRHVMEKANNAHYSFGVSKYHVVDAEDCGNESRFINHSCQPNCEARIWTVNGLKRIGFYALVDIKAGSELTIHYQSKQYDLVGFVCNWAKCKIHHANLKLN
eukprot:288690_1